MSQRVIGASPFLTGVRRLREERDRLSREEPREVTISLDTLLDACGNLAGLEAADLEVVIRPRSRRHYRTQSPD